MVEGDHSSDSKNNDENYRDRSCTGLPHASHYVHALVNNVPPCVGHEQTRFAHAQPIRLRWFRSRHPTALKDDETGYPGLSETAAPKVYCEQVSRKQLSVNEA